MHYTGFDLHKKSISICVKTASGDIVEQRKIAARRSDLIEWAKTQETPWTGVMEATIFTGWVYDTLQPFAHSLKVANPLMAKAISAAKKKSDRLDSSKLADMCRCNWIPESYLMPAPLRHLRTILRYRNKLVREAVRFQNMTAGLLMQQGCEYTKSRLHGKQYFNELFEQLAPELPAPTRRLLRLSRSMTELFQHAQKQLVDHLTAHPDLAERVQLLQTIPAVGPITALTWALEIGDPQRFRSAGKLMSYAGLTSAQNDSAENSYGGPLSRQRNKHLQTILIEAAKLAPLYNAPLKQVYEEEMKAGNANYATVAVARKLVKYLLAVDKSRQPFEVRMRTAAEPCSQPT